MSESLNVIPSLKRKYEEDEKQIANKKIKLDLKKLNIVTEEIEILFNETEMLLEYNVKLTRDVIQNINYKLFEIKKLVYNNKKLFLNKPDNLFKMESRMLKTFFDIKKYEICINMYEKSKHLTKSYKKTTLIKENEKIFIKSYLEYHFEQEQFESLKVFFENEFSKNIEVFINKMNLNDTEINKYLYYVGSAFYYCEDYERTIDIFNYINEIKDDDIHNRNLYEIIGECYFYLKNYKKANETFNKIGKDFKKRELLIYKCNNELLKNKDENKNKELFETAKYFKDFELAQELLYKINIECDICKTKNCKYLTRCFHTMCISCKYNIEGSCPYCRREDWKI